LTEAEYYDRFVAVNVCKVIGSEEPHYLICEG